jgi:hypothetical protein
MLKNLYGLDKLPQPATSVPTSPSARPGKHHVTEGHISPTIEVSASGRQVYQLRLRDCTHFGAWQAESMMIQGTIFASDDAGICSSEVSRGFVRLRRKIKS